MLTSTRLGCGSALLAMVFALGCGAEGAAGPKGDPGDPGATGATGTDGKDGTDGTDGTVPPLVNDVTGTITDGTNPLQGVSITASPGAASATTDAAGKFTLAGLALGVYELSIHKDGYVDQEVAVAVNLSGPTSVQVTLAAAPQQGTPPAVSVSDNLLAGFGAPVTLTATVTGKAPFTYKWTQKSGPEADLAGDTTDTLSFTTQPFAEAMGDHTVEFARFGTIGINPDQAGNYAFEVEVTDADGLVTKATVKVNSTRPTSGLRMVPIGIPVWLQGDGAWPNPPASTGATCATDADCGAATGQICVSAKCAAGCKGTGGGTCPSAFTCSSTTTAAGTCNKQVAWSWSLVAPAGSSATIADPTSQFPSFKPDVEGVYKVKEANGNRTLTVYAGKWTGETTVNGAPTQQCATCHSGTLASNNFVPFKETRHFKTTKEQLDGQQSPYFAEECMSCHSLGYDKTAANNGFDDVQQGSGWSFPQKLEEGNWATLVATPKLGQLAGIQCESCHGPHTDAATADTPHGSSAVAPTCTKDADCVNALTGGTGYCDTSKSPAKCVSDLGARISLSADVCSQCHQDKPYNYKPGQWAGSGHANLELAIDEGSVEQNSNNLAHCGRCHSGQGFLRYAGQLGQGYYAHLTNDGKPVDPTGVANHRATGPELARIGMNKASVQPITCAACHDPHDATNPGQLRVYDKIAALPNGMTNLSGMGSGAVCTACHNSRNAEHTDYAQNTTDTNGNFVPMPYLTSFSGPHASAQGDFVYGFNAYFMPRYSPSAHLAVKDTCAGCHYGVATGAQQMAGEDKNHSFKVDNTICASCHAENVNGEALQAANALSLDGLRALIAQRTKGIIQSAINYVPASGTMDVRIRAYDKATNSYSSSASAWTPSATGWISLIGNAPTAVSLAYASNGTTMMLELTVPNAVTFTPTAAGAAPITTNKVLVAFAGLATNQNVSGGNTTYWPPASTYYSVFSVPGPRTTGTPAIVGTYPAMPNPPPWDAPNAGQVLYKAYWNMSLLASDNTRGIHNPKFFNDVIAKTSAALNALP